MKYIYFAHNNEKRNDIRATIYGQKQRQHIGDT